MAGQLRGVPMAARPFVVPTAGPLRSARMAALLFGRDLPALCARALLRRRCRRRCARHGHCRQRATAGPRAWLVLVLVQPGGHTGLLGLLLLNDPSGSPVCLQCRCGIGATRLRRRYLAGLVRLLPLRLPVSAPDAAGYAIGSVAAFSCSPSSRLRLRTRSRSNTPPIDACGQFRPRNRPKDWRRRQVPGSIPVSHFPLTPARRVLPVEHLIPIVISPV
jgi:hypothetical protein